MTVRLRVVFAGTPENAAATLEQLISSGVHIVGVLTRLDAIAGRSKELTASPVARKAAELGLDILKSNSMDKRTLDWLSGLNPDVGAVVAYGTIFREQELGIPRLGWLNLHYSLLPELPGPAPVQHALLQGRNVTGVTVFRIDEGIDTGPIVTSESAQIFEEDDAGTLLARLTGVGTDLLVDVLLAGEARIEAATPQQVSEVHAVASKPSRELARLDFGKDARVQLHKIRAMNPEPMAWFEHNASPVRVLKASFLPSSITEVSQARIIDKQLVVGCKSGSIVLEVLQPAGKKQMSGADWFRGLQVEKATLT